MIQGRVSHYEILGRIGSGGMGVVYKAVDTRLNRPVAIKAIRESLLSPDAKARLKREALAAASVDHPFICKVYELLEHDGQTLVVLEYVEGQDLDRLLEKGRPPLRESLGWIEEIAEALGEIHRKGMVHRDVKPSNILITPQGHAKLMDFGIVKGSGPASDETALTLPDAVPGTPLYMSPEQVLGEAATARSDVFSLGIVLYRCLTGKFPFAGERRMVDRRALLESDPPPPRSVAADVPASVEAVALRCLSKDPASRFESGGAVKEALEEAVAGWAEAPGARVWLGWRSAATLAVLLTAGWGSWLVWRTSSPSNPTASVASETSLVTWPSEEIGGRISPDGRWFSFSSDRSGQFGIWAVSASGGEPKLVTDPSETGVLSHLWAPDSRRVAVLFRLGERRVIKIVPAFGGPPELVVPIEKPPRFDMVPIRWEGSLIYLAMGSQLWSLDLDTQGLQLVNDTRMRTVDISPDGKKILYSPISDDRSLWVADLDGKNAVRTSPPDFPQFGGRWAGNSEIFFLSNRTGQVDLWKASLAAPGESAQRVASSVLEIGDISGDGRTLLLTRAYENADLWCLELGTLQARQMTAQTNSDFWPNASSHRGPLVFQRSKPALGMGSRLFDAELVQADTESCRLSNERALVGDGYGPMISPRGTEVAFLRSPNPPLTGELSILRLSDGSRRKITASLQPVPFRLFPFDRRPNEMTWSPDGQTLYYVGTDDLQRPRIMAASSGGDEPRPVGAAQEGWGLLDLSVSPDGRRLAWRSWKASAKSWLVKSRPLDEAEESLVFEESAASELVVVGWLPEGRTLVLLRCFDNADGSEQRVEVVLAGLDGGVRSAGAIDRTYGNTARLDRSGQALYIAKIEGTAHNIYRFSLRDGTLSRLTQNEFQGRTFTGLQLLADRLFYSVQEHNSEVLALRLH